MTQTPSIYARHHIGITCTSDHRLHQVDEHLLASGLASGTGQLPALCGRAITAASMTDPPDAPCPLCTASLTATTNEHLRSSRLHGGLHGRR